MFLAKRGFAASGRGVDGKLFERQFYQSFSHTYTLKMGSCCVTTDCGRAIFILLNVLLLLAGGAALGFGLYTWFLDTSVPQTTSKFLITMMAYGSISIMVSLLSFFSRSKKAFTFYMVLLGIAIASQLFLTVYISQNKLDLKTEGQVLWKNMGDQHRAQLEIVVRNKKIPSLLH